MKKEKKLFFPILIFSLNIIGAAVTFLAPTARIQSYGLYTIVVANIINVIWVKKFKK